MTLPRGIHIPLASAPITKEIRHPLIFALNKKYAYICKG